MNGNESPKQTSRTREDALPAVEACRCHRKSGVGLVIPPVAWVCLVLAGTVATVASYLFADRAVSLWCLHHPSPWYTSAWLDGFRQLGKADVPLWLLAVWSCIANKWRPTVMTVLALALVGACVCPLKATVHRARPNTMPEASEQFPHESQDPAWQKKVSFPSGDTAVAFATATTLSFSLGGLWTPPLFVAASAIGLLRVTMLAHYPSDVFAGTLIGMLSGLLAVQWVGRREPLGQFRMRGRWRVVAGLLLVVVVPLVGWSIGMKALLIFLDAYPLPLVVLALVCLAVAGRRGGKTDPLGKTMP